MCVVNPLLTKRVFAHRKREGIYKVNLTVFLQDESVGDPLFSFHFLNLYYMHFKNILSVL